MIESKLIVNLTSRGSNDGPDGALKWVSFCLHCPDPYHEGSVLPALNPKHGVDIYSVTGEVVYCVPNFAERPYIVNDHQFTDRIVLVDRGKVSLLDKVLKIQETDAIGMIIADDGSCQEDFRWCGPRAGSIQEGGFAAYDTLENWLKVDIPVVLISSSSAERLRNAMGVKLTYIPGLGMHNITVHIGEEGVKEEL
eukprot:gene138-146_t